MLQKFVIKLPNYQIPIKSLTMKLLHIINIICPLKYLIIAWQFSLTNS